MHIQIVTFGLQDLADEDFVAGCADEAATFAAIPGLLSKVWLRDAEGGVYGGVYTWEDRRAMEDYLKGDIWRSLVATPQFAGVESRHFEVIEAPTRITRGYPAVHA